MTFLFVGSSVCRWLPSDPSSRRRPCLKRVVTSLGTFGFIWTLVPPQGTFTPSDHAHAGRTHVAATAILKRVGEKQIESSTVELCR